VKIKWEKINEINISKEWHVSFIQLYTNSSVLYNFFLLLMKYMINSRCDEMNWTTECRTSIWLSFSATRLDFNTYLMSELHRDKYHTCIPIWKQYIVVTYSPDFLCPLLPNHWYHVFSNVFVCLCHVSCFVVAHH